MNNVNLRKTNGNHMKTDNKWFISPEHAFKCIEESWIAWNNDVKPNVYAVGISGGVDSSCVAALACKLFGKDKVVGVSLPCDGQFDIRDVDKVFDHFGIKRITIDIGDAFNNLVNGIENNCIDMTKQCTTNMPARLRMTTLLGVAQCLNGIVLNTCNRSEDVLGWNTLFGDDCGSFAPVKKLVKTEVRHLAEWLGVPHELAYKTSIDGLQPLTDEQSFGFTYDELDAFIRCPTAVEDGIVHEDVAEKIKMMYNKNKFKLDIVDVPGPEFPFATDVFRGNLYV